MNLKETKIKPTKIILTSDDDKEFVLTMAGAEEVYNELKKIFDKGYNYSLPKIVPYDDKNMWPFVQNPTSVSYKTNINSSGFTGNKS